MDVPGTGVRPLTVAVLVKQVPRFDAMRLGADGRLDRDGVELEMNPYCRRAVSQGVALARETAGRCVVITLGPPSAEDCLREAVAWGADQGVLVCDPAFAGSDTLATARAMAGALRVLGPFDLILCGRNSVDADTAQMPTQLAELLDLPLATGVRELTVADSAVEVNCEHDDGWTQATVTMPAVLTCAERLTGPAKVKAAGRAAVPADRIRRLNAAALGPGPWGQAGSPTAVGQIRHLAVPRMRLRLDGDPDAQVRQAVAALVQAGALDPNTGQPPATVPAPRSPDTTAGRTVAVLVAPGRERATRELLGTAARLAAGGQVVALATELFDPVIAGRWGADLVVTVEGAEVEEDTAAALARWCAAQPPWAVLAPSTMWGREVAARMAARLGAGLVADAVELAVDNGRLVCWKPAFGGSLVAAITCRSPIQMVTVRSGVLPLCEPRAAVADQTRVPAEPPRGRVRLDRRTRDDDLDALTLARVVVAVGQGVPPEDYPHLRPLLDVLGAELAATRKVTDRGWQPRARQVGITGRSLSPRLFVAIGASGKFNHMAGARGAGFVLAINSDPSAPVFESADVGIVADWRQVLPGLVKALTELRTQPLVDVPVGAPDTVPAGAGR